MKYLLSGLAIAAAIAFAVPVWAQNNPSGGNPVGTMGPNPGGPPLTPYSGGAPGQPKAISPHHAIRHAHVMRAHHHRMARKAALAGDTTAQLNREELARIQSGNLSNPPAPPAPGGAAPAHQ
jgi:hypothetical protein